MFHQMSRKARYVVDSETASKTVRKMLYFARIASLYKTVLLILCLVEVNIYVLYKCTQGVGIGIRLGMDV